MVAFVLVIVISGHTMAQDCRGGALCFDNGRLCEVFAQRLNNRPDTDIQAHCEKQYLYDFKFAPIKFWTKT